MGMEHVDIEVQSHIKQHMDAAAKRMGVPIGLYLVVCHLAHIEAEYHVAKRAKEGRIV